LEESEKELVFRNKQLASLVNNSELGIVTLDKNMRIIGCNKAFEGLFLYDQTEVKGKTLDDLIVGSDHLEQDNPIKLAGSMRDISERKQSEDERKKLGGPYVWPLSMRNYIPFLGDSHVI